MAHTSTPANPAEDSPAAETASTPSTHQANARPSILGKALALSSIVVGLSAIWGIYDAIAGSPRVWGLLGFETVTLIAAIFGVTTGIKPPAKAQSLAAYNLALTIFVAATLGRFSAIATRATTPLSESQIATSLFSDSMFSFRIVMALFIAQIATAMAFGHDRKSWKKLIVGIVLAVPVIGTFAWIAGPGKDWLLSGQTASAGMLRMIVGVVGGVVLTILLAASVQAITSAFVSRMEPLPLPEKPARKKTSQKPTKQA